MLARSNRKVRPMWQTGYIRSRPQKRLTPIRSTPTPPKQSLILKMSSLDSKRRSGVKTIKYTPPQARNNQIQYTKKLGAPPAFLNSKRFVVYDRHQNTWGQMDVLNFESYINTNRANANANANTNANVATQDAFINPRKMQSTESCIGDVACTGADSIDGYRRKRH